MKIDVTIYGISWKRYISKSPNETCYHKETALSSGPAVCIQLKPMLRDGNCLLLRKPFHKKRFNAGRHTVGAPWCFQMWRWLLAWNNDSVFEHSLIYTEKSRPFRSYFTRAKKKSDGFVDHLYDNPFFSTTIKRTHKMKILFMVLRRKLTALAACAFERKFEIFLF